MGWFSRNKEQERFYLLPGMGGRALRRKQKIVLIWAVIAGLITATIVAVAILWANSQAGGTN
jgi:hypothetical protein